MPKLDAATREAIERAAAEQGIDGATALAIAERESNFDPRARNSKTIRGMFQMRGDHRGRYGVGDSDDPYAQTKGWGSFFKDVKREMAGGLGRDPTDAEGYLGHHFGGRRAATMMSMDPNTPVNAVFTPYEMSINPHFAKAGTVGRLNGTILGDIDKRRSKFGGAQGIGQNDTIDFAHLGEPVEPLVAAAGAQPPDFTASSTEANLKQGSEPVATSAPDFSNFGVPA